VQRVITAPELFTAESFSAQRPDPVPEKFRVLVPTESTEENEAGTAEMPTLTTGDLEATEQQVNVHVKRKRKTNRNATTLPKSLTQKATTNEKQVATVKETLQNGDTSVAPSALVDVQSEALGDGTYVVREVTVPKVFEATTHSAERPDIIPLKFRAKIPSQTEEKTIEGKVIKPVLTIGVLSSEEQQVNEFVKRTRVVKRDIANAGSLTQVDTTNEKQLATVTETLQAGPATEKPTATIDIQSEALGDGSFLVRKVSVPTVFKAESFVAQKVDTIPDKFKTELETKTTEKFVEGKAQEKSLTTGELERREQQINEFVYREQVTKRDLVKDTVLPDVEQTYVEGTTVLVKEKLTSTPQIQTGLNIIQSEATNVGDKKYVVQTVEVKGDWPELKSSEWDYELNTQIQKKEKFVATPTTFTEKNVQYKSVNKDRSLRIEETPPDDILAQYQMSFPVRVDVQLPNVLKSIEVKWIKEKAEGEWDTRWTGNATGVSRSLSGDEDASVDSSCTVRPELIIDIEQRWGADIPATAYVFFVKGQNGMIFSDSSIKSKLGSIAGGQIQDWPVFTPVSHTILLTGAKATITAKASANASYSANGNSTSIDSTAGDGKSYDYNYSFNAVTIPPTIHKQITLKDAGDKIETVNAKCLVGWTGNGGFPTVHAVSDITKTVKGTVEPKSLNATTPNKIPDSGKYLMKCTVEPYKWGYAKCAAVVLDAAKLKVN
jgi:hypothetical protein